VRHAEITPELIKFSKRAKELGFPQDVEEGDWVTWDSGVGGISIHLIHETYPITDNDWLILSFSRCLEWLKRQGYTLRLDELMVSSHIQLYGKKDEHTEWGNRTEAPVHHEAIAKVVVKILEGEK